MNKKGFTLVELITTFALAAVIITLLINVVLLIKNIYTKSVVKTELLINQANLSNAINSEFNKNSQVFNSFTETCPNETEKVCYSFKFIVTEEGNEGTEIIELVITKNKITFDSFVYETNEGTEIVLADVDINNSENNNFFYIKIPIKNKLYSDVDFGINIVYLYNITGNV